MTANTLNPPPRYLGPHRATTPLEVTLVLERRAGTQLARIGWPAERAPRAALAQQFPVQLDVLKPLRGFLRAHALEETGADPVRRVLQLRGEPAALEAAFGVQLGRYRMADGSECLGIGAAPRLPAGALAVLGLDTRPVARPPLRRPLRAPQRTYTPLEVATLYDFPPSDGAGQHIAIIELGGGIGRADLASYFAALGVPAPQVASVPVAGGGDAPGGAADGEVMLDIEVIGALVPAAQLTVYFAPNTDRGFFEAVSQAAHDPRGNHIISISWGGPESSWSANARTALESALEDAAALGITVTVASGDSGSDDGVGDGAPHVDFPASSAQVLACGGTRLIGQGAQISSEVVWNESAAGEGATGGGVSAVFARPAWQDAAGVPPGAQGFAGRGVPDVAGDADPLTGYQVRIDGKDQVIGGTSAVAPLWAALIARCNQQLGRPLGAANEALYRLQGAFGDITEGNNGAYGAAAGWDACTGLGTPRGRALLAALAALKP
ncbi:MAG: peptidase S53 [Gammaproteobacteria bacterium]|nr:peptidase S53 [Gammaproteobacteria bacterium]